MEENNLKILAIDDNRDNLLSLQAVVSDCLPGIRVLTALDGRQGLALAQAEDPDAILLDIVMPGMDGYEVCLQLKDDPRLQSIPVLFLTALRTGRESRVRALEVGAEGFLPKPFDEFELTAQILAMAKIKQANRFQQMEKAQLAELVAERTRELEQELAERKRSEAERETLQAQLNQARKMESIGVLAGGIAHDFNNNLAAIIGYTEMAKEELPSGSEGDHFLDRVLSAANRAKELIKQILAFSRQSAINRIPLEIQPIVKETLKMLRASLPSTIVIKENIQPYCGVVLADPTQIHQIVLNLCTNAYQAMESRGGVLAVALRKKVIDSRDNQHLPSGHYVELTVSDTGNGIKPEIIDRIFEPYFTTKEIGKGTGMGLAITHGIVADCEGAITVESTLGQGSTFQIHIPVIWEPAKELESLPKVPRGQGRILFVDDEQFLSEMGQAMLEQLGYGVTSRSKSMEALALFKDDPYQFDLVITDQTMPELTGTELAQQLLTIRPNLPIILCTGFSNLVNEESAKAMGIREFAFKPLLKSSLAQMIKKVLI